MGEAFGDGPWLSLSPELGLVFPEEPAAPFLLHVLERETRQSVAIAVLPAAPGGVRVVCKSFCYELTKAELVGIFASSLDKGVVVSMHLGQERRHDAPSKPAHLLQLTAGMGGATA